MKIQMKGEKKETRMKKILQVEVDFVLAELLRATGSITK
jgi:hypothetical protein